MSIILGLSINTTTSRSVCDLYKLVAFKAPTSVIMKSVVVKHFYETLDQLHVSEVPKPNPKQDELLIKVIAAGVNFVDTLYVCASTWC